MKKHCLLLFCLICIPLMGQSTYKPDWESIDKRPVPAWFENAKLLFKHQPTKWFRLQPRSPQRGVSLDALRVESPISWLVLFR